MNRLVKDMLMARYDSRGDYYDDRYRSDYTSDFRRRDMRRGDGTYAQPYYDNHNLHYEHHQQHPDSRRDMRDYSDDYARGYSRDRGETRYGKMSHHDIKSWERNLMNSDGTNGAHFREEQIVQESAKHSIHLDRFGGAEVFTMAVNMMYADYCGVAKKFGVDSPDFYICLAKAFLEDKDFKGDGEEKLWLYYKCIAEQED